MPPPISRPAVPFALLLTLTAYPGAMLSAQQPAPAANSVRDHLPEVRIEVARLAVGGIPLARAFRRAGRPRNDRAPRATFQTTATLAAPYPEGDEDDGPRTGAPDEDDEELEAPMVRPGHRMPLIPALSATLGAEYASRGWILGAEASHVGSRRLRGDEDNEGEPLGAYTLLGARLERGFGRLALFAEVDNLLDAEHETFGVLTRNRLNDPETPRLEPFLTPGMPRRAFVGARFRW